METSSFFLHVLAFFMHAVIIRYLTTVNLTENQLLFKMKTKVIYLCYSYVAKWDYR